MTMKSDIFIAVAACHIFCVELFVWPRMITAEMVTNYASLVYDGEFNREPQL